MASPSASDRTIVVTGGDPIDVAIVSGLDAGSLVIAADSGIDHALALGLRIDVAVGDFDSVTPEALERARHAGAVLERHPAAKDATDLELALDAAVARGARHIHVLGGHGGRLDHLLANALLLASPRYESVAIVADIGAARVTVARDVVTLHGTPGDLVTLLAAHGPARGVATEGLLYPLRDEDLPPGSTRGVSNELDATTAVVRVASGALLVIQPGPELRPQPPSARTSA